MDNGLPFYVIIIQDELLKMVQFLPILLATFLSRRNFRDGNDPLESSCLSEK